MTTMTACFSNNVDLIAIWIAAISLIVTLISVYLAIRFHFVSIINTLAIDRARECNNHLIPFTNFRPDANVTVLSGVLSAITVYPQIINLHVKLGHLKLLRIGDRHIRELLLLQLHTNIRIYLKNVDSRKIESARRTAQLAKMSEEDVNVLVEQLNDCHAYFQGLYH